MSQKPPLSFNNVSESEDQVLVVQTLEGQRERDQRKKARKKKRKRINQPQGPYVGHHWAPLKHVIVCYWKMWCVLLGCQILMVRRKRKQIRYRMIGTQLKNLPNHQATTPQTNRGQIMKNIKSIGGR